MLSFGIKIGFWKDIVSFIKLDILVKLVVI
jgi:hypothetical protein